MPGRNRNPEHLTIAHLHQHFPQETMNNSDPTQRPSSGVQVSSSSAPHTLRTQRSALRTRASPLTNTNRSETRQYNNGQPRKMSVGNRTAAMQIDFLIVGGGLAGLACAFALGKSGHRVTVLEKAKGLHQRSAGIRVPPNLSKILSEWGLVEEIANAQKCGKSVFHSMETGEVLGYLEWQEDVIKETGGDFLLMHYDDLHTLMYKSALSVGAKIIFDTPVNSVFVDENGFPSVTIPNNDILSADVLIGADGYYSIVKELVTGEPDNNIHSGHAFYTIMVPADKLKNDPDWAKWVDISEWPMWMGDSRSVLGYPVRNEFCVHAYLPDTAVKFEDDRLAWDAIIPTSAIDFSGSHPSISRLFSLVPDALRAEYLQRDLPEDLVDETGRIVIIGEAAHPMMPCTMHNPSLSIEDAAVLGVLFSRLHSKNQISQLLYAFEDLRLPRCRNVQQSELQNAALVTLPPGEHREMRNAGLRLSLNPKEGQWDDEQLRVQWDQIGEAFGYNAREAAEDWWIKWGVLGNTHPIHDPIHIFQNLQETKDDVADGLHDEFAKVTITSLVTS